MILVLAAVLVIAGCAAGIGRKKKIDSVTAAIENDTSAQEGIYLYLEEKVLPEFAGRLRDGYKRICSFCLLGVDGKYIYVYAGTGDYAAEGERHLKCTNQAQVPVRLRYQYADGKLTLTDHFFPGDGAQYSRNLKQHFSKAARAKLAEMTNEEYKALEELCLKRACRFFGIEYGPQVLIENTQETK
ncbi:MAG: hypothetical protein J5496_04065 [Lachnospiraceae bacterium]|nr:hypothetical protein [Lachnospiraceae bacterium]